LTRSRHFPGALLIALALAVGLLSFQDYGLSWDEPLFYDYAAALPYAYSPREWLSGSLDLTRAFGASAADHANRGPAYLLLARPVELALEGLGLDMASAWHLTNFLTFCVGLLAFYELCLRWLQPRTAFLTAALLGTQPLLWGHAFINPKDVPLLVGFLASIWLGFRMNDAYAAPQATVGKRAFPMVVAAVALGVTTSIRVVAPLAGGLVCLHAISSHLINARAAPLARGIDLHRRMNVGRHVASRRSYHTQAGHILLTRCVDWRTGFRVAKSYATAGLVPGASFCGCAALELPPVLLGITLTVPSLIAGWLVLRSSSVGLLCFPIRRRQQIPTRPAN
jgi:hypothetical protein